MDQKEEGQNKGKTDEEKEGCRKRKRRKVRKKEMKKEMEQRGDRPEEMMQSEGKEETGTDKRNKKNARKEKKEKRRKGE